MSVKMDVMFTLTFLCKETGPDCIARWRLCPVFTLEYLATGAVNPLLVDRDSNVSNAITLIFVSVVFIVGKLINTASTECQILAVLQSLQDDLGEPDDEERQSFLELITAQ